MKHTLVRTLLVCVLIAALSCFAFASCTTPCTHTYGEPSVTTEPTCTAKGSQTLTCTLCGETKTEEIPALGHDGHATCGVCHQPIVTVEQLTPVLPETAEGIKLVIDDLVMTSTYGDEPETQETMTTKVNATFNLYPTEEGTLFAYGTMSMAYDDQSPEVMTVYYDGQYVLVKQTASYGGEEYTQQMLLSPMGFAQALSSDPTRLIGEQGAAMLEQTIFVIETYILPLFEGTEEPAPDDIIPGDPATADMLEQLLGEALQTVLDNFFTVKVTEGGTDVVFDLTTVREWNEEMAEATVATLLDKVAGEGTYAQLVAAAPLLLDVTMEDFIAYLEQTTGMTMEEIVTLAEQILQAYMGEEFTLEAFLGAPIDILLADPDFLSTTVVEFLIAATTAPDATPPTKAELLAKITQVTTMLQTIKIYDLLSNNAGAQIKADIDAAIDAVEDNLQYTIHLDKDGKFVGCTNVVAGMTAKLTAAADAFTIALSGEGLSGSMSISFTPDKLTDMTAYEELFDTLTEAIPTFNDDFFAANGFDCIEEGVYLYADEYSTFIDTEEGTAEVYTTVIDLTLDVPLAVMVSDGYVSILFSSTEITENYTFAPNTEPDLGSLSPVTIDYTLTTTSLLVFPITE